mmetsp:Transcript_2200/g.6555  ORF Transcript_2200/g.6555 Transcript_2200/m.6555 type:complete len:204 (-) Transcript_2200:67-678(-)
MATAAGPELKRRKADAPLRPISPYAVFLKTTITWTRNRLGPDADELDVLDAVLAEWQAMSPKEQRGFVDTAEQEAARYATELEAYGASPLVETEAETEAPEAPAPAPAEPKKKPSRRKRKDPDAPSKGPSAFLMFANETRPQLRAEFPAKHNVELSKILGQRWRAMDAAAKEPYLARERESKGKYEAEMKSWKEKGGDDFGSH